MQTELGTSIMWKVIRNWKMQFSIARHTEDGLEYLENAYGKPRSFKVWSNAQEIADKLNSGK